MGTIGLRLPAPRQAHLTLQSIDNVKLCAMLDGLTCSTKAPTQAGAALSTLAQFDDQRYSTTKSISGHRVFHTSCSVPTVPK
jgi:hypothetical protein